MADKVLNVRIQLRHDTEANWTTVDPVLLAGEAAVTLDGDNKGRIKIGDGTSKWSALDYLGGEDTLLAKSVMFDSDMVFTEQFGKYKPTDGKVTIPSNNKSLYEVLIDAYSEDKNPTITQPSMTISSSTAKAYEVGTNVTPAYSSSFNAGSYEYGPNPTGVTATTYAASNNKTEETADTATGTFAEYQVVDGSNYNITLAITALFPRPPLAQIMTRARLLARLSVRPVATLAAIVTASMVRLLMWLLKPRAMLFAVFLRSLTRRLLMATPLPSTFLLAHSVSLSRTPRPCVL